MSNKKMLTEFLEQLGDYVAESGTNIFDKNDIGFREPSGFADIFLQNNPEYQIEPEPITAEQLLESYNKISNAPRSAYMTELKLFEEMLKYIEGKKATADELNGVRK